jgi:hypothetical protein
MADILQAPVNDGFFGDAKSKIKSLAWNQWFTQLVTIINAANNTGFTGTIITAKLTGGGTNGSITLVNGKIISQVAAT